MTISKNTCKNIANGNFKSFFTKEMFNNDLKAFQNIVALIPKYSNSFLRKLNGFKKSKLKLKLSFLNSSSGLKIDDLAFYTENLAHLVPYPVYNKILNQFQMLGMKEKERDFQEKTEKINEIFLLKNPNNDKTSIEIRAEDFLNIIGHDSIDYLNYTGRSDSLSGDVYNANIIGASIMADGVKKAIIQSFYEKNHKLKKAYSFASHINYESGNFFKKIEQYENYIDSNAFDLIDFDLIESEFFSSINYSEFILKIYLKEMVQEFIDRKVFSDDITENDDNYYDIIDENIKLDIILKTDNNTDYVINVYNNIKDHSNKHELTSFIKNQIDIIFLKYHFLTMYIDEDFTNHFVDFEPNETENDMFVYFQELLYSDEKLELTDSVLTVIEKYENIISGNNHFGNDYYEIFGLFNYLQMKYSLLLKLSAHQENFGENGPFNHLNIDELTSQDDLINSIEMMCIDNLNLFKFDYFVEGDLLFFIRNYFQISLFEKLVYNKNIDVDINNVIRFFIYLQTTDLFEHMILNFKNLMFEIADSIDLNMQNSLDNPTPFIMGESLSDSKKDDLYAFLLNTTLDTSKAH